MRLVLLLMSLVVISCSASPEDARRELGQLGIPYTEDALFEVVRRGDSYAVSLLLQAGMSPSVVDPAGNSALMAALKDGDAAVARILLRAGASVDVADRTNTTPLCLAFSLQRPSSDPQDMALAKDIISASKTPETSLPCVFSDWSGEYFLQLIDMGIDTDTSIPYWLDGEERSVPPLVPVIVEGDTSAVAVMLAMGSGINDVPQGGASPLAYAAFDTDPHMIRYLVRNGADVNPPTGTAPLLVLLSQIQDREVAAFLLDQGADATATVLGDTGLHLVANFMFPDTVLVSLLLDHGVDPHHKNWAGESAYDRFRRHRLGQASVRTIQRSR